MKNSMKKIGSFIRKHKNFGIYMAGIFLVSYGLTNEGYEAGYDKGVEQGSIEKRV